MIENEYNLYNDKWNNDGEITKDDKVLPLIGCIEAYQNAMIRIIQEELVVKLPDVAVYDISFRIVTAIIQPSSIRGEDGVLNNMQIEGEILSTEDSIIEILKKIKSYKGIKLEWKE